MPGGPPSSLLNDPSYYNAPKPKTEVTLDVDPFSFVKGTMAPPAPKNAPIPPTNPPPSQGPPSNAAHSSGFNGSLAPPEATPSTSAFNAGSDPFAPTSAFGSSHASASQPSASFASMDSDPFFSSKPAVTSEPSFPHPPAAATHDPFAPSQQTFSNDPFSGSASSFTDPFSTNRGAVAPQADPFNSSSNASDAAFGQQSLPAAGNNAFSAFGGDAFGQPASSDPFFASMGPAAMASDDFFGKTSPARASTTSSTSVGGFTDDFGITWDNPPATATASNGKDPMTQLRETYGLQEDERDSESSSADRNRASHARGTSGFGSSYEAPAVDSPSGPMEGRILARHSAVSLLTSSWEEQYWSISQGNLMLFKDE